MTTGKAWLKQYDNDLRKEIIENTLARHGRKSETWENYLKRRGEEAHTRDGVPRSMLPQKVKAYKAKGRTPTTGDQP